MGVSAVVITKNEESSLADCLRSLAFADEIVVLDSFSTDKTAEIAGRYTDRFFERKFTGFSDQRNAAMELAREEWILFVDADEIISDELAAEIMHAVKTGKHDAYRMPRLTYFLGKPIRHCGWYPDYILRLGKRSKISIPSRLVHESLTVECTVGKLSNPIIHHSYRSISAFFHKTDLYNIAAAKQKIREGYKFHLADLIVRPVFTFQKTYFQKLGFLDGVHGLVLCILMACAVAFRYAVLWDLSRVSGENIKSQ